MKAVTELQPCTVASRGMLKQRLVVDNTLEARWQNESTPSLCRDWLVLDRRMCLDQAIWKLIHSHVTMEDRAPDACAFVIQRSDQLAGGSWLEQLDHHAYFRQESQHPRNPKSTAAALVLGKQVERAVDFSDLECLVKAVTKVAQNIATAPAPAPGRRRRAPKEKYAEPREPRHSWDALASTHGPGHIAKDFRSGRNPKGLNLYIPRRKSSDLTSLGRLICAAGIRLFFLFLSPSLFSTTVLTCEATGDLEAFMQQHRPTGREAEQICVWSGGESTCDPEDLQGLLEDGARLEKTGSLSQATVVQLAKKWQILTGKWLLFVPEWRIDVPHLESVMSLGKSLRAAARHGLRCYNGDWGELLDDPFAAPGKKVSLVFKPDVFSRLSLHKNNPYGIKTTLHVLDL
eukprot:Skav219883  [mRNA]  locus=scaffold777:416045:419923:- [translate_table: standard]